MKKVLFFILTLFSHTATADPHLTFSQQGAAAIKEFSVSLKGELIKAMKAGGPIEAITVCNIQAPLIAEKLSQKYTLQIGRTSLKVRNPNNLADPWEKKVLNRFEDLKEKSTPVASLLFSEHSDGEMRMMKAIPTGQVCLTCHGNNISENIKSKIKKLYPDDQATGFQIGDIRGAFTVRQHIQK